MLMRGMDTTTKNEMKTKLSPEFTFNFDLYFADFISTNIFPSKR
jgi:hypothetical protein